MSFQGTLNIDNTTYTVLKFSFELKQPVDSHNRPFAVTKGGLLYITIESSSDTKLLEWMLSPNMMKWGYLIFQRRDVERPMRPISFNDAFCIDYREVFDSITSQPMQTELTLSARVLNFGGNLQLTNRWPGEYAEVKSENKSQSGQGDGAVGNPSGMY